MADRPLYDACPCPQCNADLDRPDGWTPPPFTPYRLPGPPAAPEADDADF